MPVLSTSLIVVPGSRRAARINSRVARRLGWKPADIVVVQDDKEFAVVVNNHDFDMFRDNKLLLKIGKRLSVTVKDRNFNGIGLCFSAKLKGEAASDYCTTFSEALARAILAAPRSVIRGLRDDA